MYISKPSARLTQARFATISRANKDDNEQLLISTARLLRSRTYHTSRSYWMSQVRCWRVKLWTNSALKVGPFSGP